MIPDDVKYLGDVFCDALQQVVFTCTGFSLSISIARDENVFGEVVGVMSLAGKKQGIVFISGNKSEIRKLNTFMTGSSDDEVTNEDINDTLSEIVNMTAGNSKVRLGNSDYMFQITTPFILRGNNIRISTKKRVNRFTRVLSDENISLRLMIVF